MATTPDWIRRRIAIPVDFNSNLWDAQIRDYTLAGFTAPYVASVTGLTVSRVRYRLKKIGVSAMGYRRGTSAVARKVKSNINRKLLTDSRIRYRTVESFLSALRDAGRCL